MLTKVSVLIMLLSLVATTAQAQIDDKVGTTGFQFLKIGVGTRETALGGAGTAYTAGPAAIFWNVAGITAGEKTAVLFFHNRWIGDMHHNFIACTVPATDQHFFGIAVDLLSVGDMEETTIDQPQGTGRTFDAGDMFIAGSYAARISERFSAGVSVKYIREHIWDLVTDGWAFDVGLQYVYERVRVGMAFKDFGSEKTIGGAQLESNQEVFEDWDTSPALISLVPKGIRLPISFHIGAGVDVIQADEHRVLVMGNLSYFNDIGQTQQIGVEYTLFNSVSVRGGYHFGRELLSATGGLGARAAVGSMDITIGFSALVMKDFGTRTHFDLLLTF